MQRLSPLTLALLALLITTESRAAEPAANTSMAKTPADSTWQRYMAEEVTVAGEKGEVLEQVTGEESSLLNPSQMSVYKVINMMPSVSQQSVDPYGLADIVNYHESFKFRGVEATAGGVPSTTVNVEGLPVTGRPGGGATIYDLENMENITIYTGVMPANKGLGLSDIGGKINMQIRRPDDEFGVALKESVGSNSFRRTFFRVDSGELGGGFKAFASGSTSYYEKWKGYGASNRNNMMLGLSETFSENVKLEAFATYSKGLIHTYRPLSYEDIQDMSIAYNKDYTNDPRDYWYYDYNKNEFEDWMLMANLEIKTGEASKLNIKPYYWSDTGYYLETTTPQPGTNLIRRWDIDHNLKGILTEYTTAFGDLDLDFGYLYHSQERPGPPTSWKNYTVTSSGDLAFKNWAILSNTSSHILHEPFIEATYQTGDWLVEGGFKYVNYALPSIITYNTTGIGDMSYEAALASDPTIDLTKSALDTKSFSRIFPDVTLTRYLGEDTSVYIAYGETFATHVDIYPYYIQNYNAFQKLGVNFDQLWNDKEMETAQNFELGMLLSGDNWQIVPTLYYAIHENKQAMLYDPSLAVYYPMNNAHAKGYGLELEGEYTPTSELKCYGSFSWNRFYFDQNILSDATKQPIDVQGEQVPDAPEFMAKGMVSYRIGDLTISPIARYSSARYGDVLHTQKVDGATVFDLDFTWSRSMLGFRQVDCSLSLINIFDKQYISMISTSDYKTMKTSYQPGAPFTVVASLAIHY